ncbi:threonylcarbamoyl-AMP synthase [Candidatus Dojkabacteria bacterium]|uniref:L-threonylcarbamoyladenylate synthase n=1 Tax=Candidatus Dojkabacteria bacterium TaxID=2099670 RepID=A0A847VDT7_9BACT|nr:threonylcarbamoyl-AMP synthase [Candidatus Dojkabacteria bacterium]
MKRVRLTNSNASEVIQQARKILNEGGLIVYPTETSYGLGVDATNQNALLKLLTYKTFRGSKPVSIAVNDIQMAKKYVHLNEMAENIYKNYLPGPITVISKSLGILKPPVVSKQGTTGVRIPDNKFVLKLIKEFGRPITATSANVSYRSHPYSIDQLLKDLPQKSERLVDLYIDAGQLPKNMPSTILDTTLNTPTILREGKIMFEDAILQSTLLEEKSTNTPLETLQFGEFFTKEYLRDIQGGVVVALSGELGAGKTQFSKGIGKGLGSKDIVTSPTYTIINEYRYGDNILAHVDTWRIMDEDDFHRSGILQHLEKKEIVVIEWADKFYNEIENLCRERNIPMYKILFEYISLERRKITIYGTN